MDRLTNSMASSPSASGWVDGGDCAARGEDFGDDFGEDFGSDMILTTSVRGLSPSDKTNGVDW